MNMGIWVDHRQAVLVSVGDGPIEVSHMESGITSHPRSTGGWRSGGTAVPQCISNEQRVDERYKHQLHRFYSEIMKKVASAGNLFIFGPGKAKTELRREIENIKGEHPRISAVEPCDKLTEPQVKAKVKEFFTTWTAT